jgi:hypothetical protein
MIGAAMLLTSSETKSLIDLTIFVDGGFIH